MPSRLQGQARHQGDGKRSQSIHTFWSLLGVERRSIVGQPNLQRSSGGETRSDTEDCAYVSGLYQVALQAVSQVLAMAGRSTHLHQDSLPFEHRHNRVELLSRLTTSTSTAASFIASASPAASVSSEPPTITSTALRSAQPPTLLRKRQTMRHQRGLCIWSRRWFLLRCQRLGHRRLHVRTWSVQTDSRRARRN